MLAGANELRPIVVLRHGDVVDGLGVEDLEQAGAVRAATLDTAKLGRAPSWLDELAVIGMSLPPSAVKMRVLPTSRPAASTRSEVSTMARIAAIVFSVRVSETPAITTHGAGCARPTDSPSAAQPAKRTGPHSSARQRAPRNGDLPQPFARRRTARR